MKLPNRLLDRRFAIEYVNQRETSFVKKEKKVKILHADECEQMCSWNVWQ